MESTNQSSLSISTDQNLSNLRNREPDLEQFKLSQDFEAMIGVRREIITVPVRKPDRQSFIQIHPDEEWRMSALILELKEDRDNYLVIPSLMESFPDEFVPKYLFTCQTRQGATFLWPIRMPGPDGRLDQWNESALHIVNQYAGRWIRVISNMGWGDTRWSARTTTSPLLIGPRRGSNPWSGRPSGGRSSTLSITL